MITYNIFHIFLSELKKCKSQHLSRFINRKIQRRHEGRKFLGQESRYHVSDSKISPHSIDKMSKKGSRRHGVIFYRTLENLTIYNFILFSHKKR